MKVFIAHDQAGERQRVEKLVADHELNLSARHRIELPRERHSLTGKHAVERTINAIEAGLFSEARGHGGI